MMCECGERIGKNLFSGQGVHLVVPEELLDRDFTGQTAEQLARELVLKNDRLLTCKACQRLYLVDEAQKREPRAYRREP